MMMAIVLTRILSLTGDSFIYTNENSVAKLIAHFEASSPILSPLSSGKMAAIKQSRIERDW